jgi:hypothetical protein
MHPIFIKAVEELGSTDFISQWQLPNGKFLDWPNQQDHRWCGQWCSGGYDGWREFLMRGAVSICYIPNENFLWIRTIGLNANQRMAWARLIEEEGFEIKELKVDYYIFDTPEKFKMDIEEINEELAHLYLTDTTSYQIRKRELENE